MPATEVAVLRETIDRLRSPRHARRLLIVRAELSAEPMPSKSAAAWPTNSGTTVTKDIAHLPSTQHGERNNSVEEIVTVGSALPRR